MWVFMYACIYVNDVCMSAWTSEQGFVCVISCMCACEFVNVYVHIADSMQDRKGSQLS